MDKLKPLPWDLFCRVIDNYGDIGVCWRLAADLASRGQPVRLWVDDASALAWMAPDGREGVEVLAWTPDMSAPDRPAVVVEAFGCELPENYQAALARWAGQGGTVPWINLEYLTAESFAERSHGLPSPVMSGPAKGLTKHFFYPGFTPRTGGLLREPGLLAQQAAFDRAAWLASLGIDHDDELLVSLFCYEPAALAGLLEQLANGARPARLLVTPGRAAAAVTALAGDESAWGMLGINYLPSMPQTAYDGLLWACDFNFVRGEDSLVRALWAGRPFVWQAYPQDDGVHHDKLEAFLETIEAPPSLRQFHRAWNGGPGVDLPPIDPGAWGACAGRARDVLLAQEDLASQLLRFVQKNR